MADVAWQEDSTSTAAVIAHGVLNSMMMILAAVDTIREERNRLSTADFDRLLDFIEKHLRCSGHTLQAVARALPMDARDLMAAVDADARARHTGREAIDVDRLPSDWKW